MTPKNNPLPSVSADLVACVQQLELVERELADIAGRFSMKQIEERIADDEKWCAEQKYLREHWQTGILPAHRWISVDDMLPDPYVEVLIYVPGTVVSVSSYSSRYLCWSHELPTYANRPNPTHWQPLPLPPEEEYD